jgi:hypothetical protein
MFQNSDQVNHSKKLLQNKPSLMNFKDPEIRGES